MQSDFRRTFVGLPFGIFESVGTELIFPKPIRNPSDFGSEPKLMLPLRSDGHPRLNISTIWFVLMSLRVCVEVCYFEPSFNTSNTILKKQSKNFFFSSFQIFCIHLRKLISSQWLNFYLTSTYVKSYFALWSTEIWRGMSFFFLKKYENNWQNSFEMRFLKKILISNDNNDHTFSFLFFLNEMKIRIKILLTTIYLSITTFKQTE